MTVSHVAAGNTASGTTSLSVPFPASVASGDLATITIVSKYPSNNPSLPSGWSETSPSVATGGHGSAGIDSGNAAITVFYKVCAGTEGGTSVTVTVTSGNTCFARINVWTKTTGTWDVKTVSDAINTPVQDVNQTAPSNPGIAAGDVIMFAFGINGNGYTFTPTGFTATGCTFSNTIERTDAGTGNGQDCGLYVCTASVDTGPASAAPNFQMTASAAAGTDTPAGGVLWVVLHEQSATEYPQSVAGAISPAGALGKQTQTARTGAVSPSGALGTYLIQPGVANTDLFDQWLTNRRFFWVGKPTAIEANPGRFDVWQTARRFFTIHGQIAGAQAFEQTLSGTLSSTGALIKQTNTSLSGAFTSAGALINQGRKTLAGAFTSAGALVNQTRKPLSGALSPSGDLAKQARRALSGALSFAGALTKQANKVLAGLVSFPGQATLLFEDTFSGASLDLNKWTRGFDWQYSDGGPHNTELQWYTNDGSNIQVSNGTCKLIAQVADPPFTSPNQGGSWDYTSGIITTGRDYGHWTDPTGKFSFTYGYAEARMKNCAGKGFWPAFWMKRDDDPDAWPPEIDIMEMLGDSVTTHRMHYHYFDGVSNQDSGTNYVGTDLTNDFHIFAVEWTASDIVWYLDGIERKRFSTAQYISSVPMSLLLNLAVGGWAGAPDGSTVFPNQVEIDYVRVWNKNPYHGARLLKQTGKVLAGGVSFAAGLAWLPMKVLSGAISPAGALVRQTARSISGAISPGGALIAARVVLKILSGAVSFAGGLVNQTNKALSGAVSPAGNLLKQIRASFSGAVSPAGELASIRTFLKAVTGALSFAGSLARQTQFHVSGTMSPAGALTAVITFVKLLAGAVSFSGALVKQGHKLLSGALSPAGAISAKLIFTKILDGTLSASGALIRQTRTSLAASLSPAGTLLKETRKAFTGALSSAGSLARTVIYTKLVGGALTFAGGLVRDTRKALAGSLTPAGDLTRQTRKFFSGVVSFAGDVVGQLPSTALAWASRFRGMWRGMNKGR